MCTWEAEYVIAGISGRFPGSSNLEELAQGLFCSVDMLEESSRRWNIHDYVIASRMGMVPDLEKFDADLFGISGKQAHVMDPRLQASYSEASKSLDYLGKLLEVTYEAILDSGVSPKEMSGSNVGVYISSTNADALEILLRADPSPSSYTTMGSSPFMLANQISHALNINGPSFYCDSGCSGSLIALNEAVLALRVGSCKIAVVGSANINFSPAYAASTCDLGILSPSGRCKTFDKDCDGFVRSEAVVSMLVCQKVVAKRTYATIKGIKCNNDGYKTNGISFPSQEMQTKLLRELYSEIGLDPLKVGYFEAHGTATKVGDPKEVNAVADVLCKERQGPLLIGSIKTNIGHTEASSGLCGIAKMILARRAGILPPNLHFQEANPEIPALVDGRIEVVTKLTRLTGRYVGISSFGLGGTNAHVVLDFEEDSPGFQETYEPEYLPKLLCASGRTEHAVRKFLSKAVKYSEKPDFVGLLHEITTLHEDKHLYTGFTISRGADVKTIVEKTCRISKKPSVWYILTGHSSCWTHTAEDMMKFKHFRNSVDNSMKVLSLNGFDVCNCLQGRGQHTSNSFRHADILTTVIQVALIDLLKSLKILHDGIVGSSTGEFASAYADDCLTHKQVLLICLSRSRALLESDLPPSKLTEIEMTWEEASQRCPVGIFPAIHNSRDMATIAGPPGSVNEFVQTLVAEGRYVEDLPFAHYGLHSPYVSNSERMMKKYFKEVLPEHKLRSRKWRSSSIPEDYRDSKLGKYCSVDYYINNALSPVYLYETLQHIPRDAVVLEVSPDCRISFPQKLSLPMGVTYVGLMINGCSNSSLHFLESLGRLYMNNVDVTIGALYKSVKFPVSRPMPSISSMFDWDHSADWCVPDFQKTISLHNVTYSIDTSNDEFYLGHRLQGRTMLPVTTYLWLAWKAFARKHSTRFECLGVCLENVKFHRMTDLNLNCKIDFNVCISDEGRFNITEGGEIVCDGNIQKFPHNSNAKKLFSFTGLRKEGNDFLSTQDFYKFLAIRGYEFAGEYTAVSKIDAQGSWAELKWTDNWVCFLHAMLQAMLFNQMKSKDAVTPFRLQEVILDPVEFQRNRSGNSILESCYCEYLDIIQCSGIQYRGITTSTVTRAQEGCSPIVEEMSFVPYLDGPAVIDDEQFVADFFLQIAFENGPHHSFVATQVLESRSCIYEPKTFFLSERVLLEYRLVNLLPYVPKYSNPRTQYFTTIEEAKYLSKCDILFLDSLNYFPIGETLVTQKGFIAIFTDTGSDKLEIPLEKIAQKETKSGLFTLYRKGSESPLDTASVVSTDDSDFGWVEILKDKLDDLRVGMILLVARDTHSGVVGFIKSLLQETGDKDIRCYLLDDSASWMHHLEGFLNYATVTLQMRKDLRYNIYRGGNWGCFGNFRVSVEQLRTPKRSLCAYANIGSIGDLSSLCWNQAYIRSNENWERCIIMFAALNFRDVLYAAGKISKNLFPKETEKQASLIGCEFSGLYKGMRISGYATNMCLATCVEIENYSWRWKVPMEWTTGEAATFPVAYNTVLYSLLHRAKLQAGESVLIHSGCGGVGIAAITIALKMKCTVYTTVGSAEKHDILKAMFPALKDENIGNSRCAQDFEDKVLLETRGKGVDVVLNSLVGDGLVASIRCLAKHGRFMDIGKYDGFRNSSMGLAFLSRSARVEGSSLDQIINDSRTLSDMILLVQEHIELGFIDPLPLTCFSHEELEIAFRHLANGDHVGKVIVRINEPYRAPQITAVPKSYFHSHRTYIIIGGLGGMGLEVIDWMVEQGAVKLYIVSRSGITTDYQRFMINKWQRLGVGTCLKTTDVTSLEQMSDLLTEADTNGGLGGIFNMALVLEDTIFDNHSSSTFKSICACKVTATRILDALTRARFPELEHFVVFSSQASIRGNAGQTAYAYANSAMERICERRKQDGFHALAIQWGAVGDVGAAADMLAANKGIAGFAAQPIFSCIKTLDLLLFQPAPVIGTFVLADNVHASVETSSISACEAVGRILGIQDILKVESSSTLVDLGMDSMMVAEIQKVLISEFKFVLPTLKDYWKLTFKDLIAIDEGSCSGA